MVNEISARDKWLFIVFLAFIAGGFVELFLYPIFNPCPICVQGDLNHTFSEIQEKCNSTYIVKNSWQNEWMVFTNDCRPDGYCKYGYRPLRECLP